jgi:hypothetical protein
MPTPEQKKKLLRAKIAVAYYRETGKKSPQSKSLMTSLICPRLLQSHIRPPLQTAGAEAIRATADLLTAIIGLALLGILRAYRLPPQARILPVHVLLWKARGLPGCIFRELPQQIPP